MTDDWHHSGETEHYVELFQSRHFEETVEIWCPIRDEEKVVLGRYYTEFCPMCGETIAGWYNEHDSDRNDLLEQAEAVQEAVEASMYYPVAHGEAEALQNMIERYVDADDDHSGGDGDD